MIKSVVINLGHGSLEQGFPLVIAQRFNGDRLIWEGKGSLPPATELARLHRDWNTYYDASKERFSTLSVIEDDDEDDFQDKPSVTQYSEATFQQIREQITKAINAWLKSDGFIRLDFGLRRELNRNEGILVIIKTDDDFLWTLPWERWDFFDDFYAAISYAKLTAEGTTQTFQKKKVRVLAIRGSDEGTDLKQSFNPLEKLPDAEIVKLEKPSRQQFDAQLWDKAGWHILFYTGHSDSKDAIGKMYINDNKSKNYLTIEELKEALKAAIDLGLKIAFFNSCDGVGLATKLADLKIVQVVCMKREVPNYVAQEFFKYFMEAFAEERLRFDLAVNKARKKLQGLEDEFPGASWLPLIYLNSAERPPTWQDFLEDIPLWTSSKCVNSLSQPYYTRTGLAILDDLGKNVVSFVGKNILQLGQKIAFSPDESHFVSCGYEAIDLWSPPFQIPLRRFMEPEPKSILEKLAYKDTYFTSVATNGKIIAGCKNDKIYLWNINGLLQQDIITKSSCDYFDIYGYEGLAFSADGQLFAYTDDKDAKIWNLNTQTLLHFSNHWAPTTDVAFSPTEPLLASSSEDNNIILWDLNTKRTKNILSGHSQGVVSIAFSPDGKILASASKDKTVKLWCTNTGVEKKTLFEHSAEVLAVAFSPDGQTLASGSDDKKIYLWSVEGNLKGILSEHERGVISLAFSPDGRSLVSGSRDQTIKIWETS